MRSLASLALRAQTQTLQDLASSGRVTIQGPAIEANDGDGLKGRVPFQELLDLGQCDPGSFLYRETERPGADRREGDGVKPLVLSPWMISIRSVHGRFAALIAVSFRAHRNCQARVSCPKWNSSGCRISARISNDSTKRGPGRLKYWL